MMPLFGWWPKMALEVVAGRGCFSTTKTSAHLLAGCRGIWDLPRKKRVYCEWVPVGTTKDAGSKIAIFTWKALPKLVPTGTQADFRR